MDRNWLDDEDEDTDPDDPFEGGVDPADDWLSCQPPPGGDLVSPGPSETGVDLFMDALNEESTPRGFRSEIVPVGTSDVLRRQIITMRYLQPKQRVFIRCLLQTAGSVKEALKIFNARFTEPMSFGSAMKWMRKPEFKSAYAAAKEHVLGVAGLDPQGVMLKSQRVYEEAMTPSPILYKGRHTGFFEQDRANAMRAVEFQGRANGMLKDAETSRVTVQIVNLSSRKEAEAEAKVIDG